MTRVLICIHRLFDAVDRLLRKHHHQQQDGRSAGTANGTSDTSSSCSCHARGFQQQATQFRSKKTKEGSQLHRGGPIGVVSAFVEGGPRCRFPRFIRVRLSPFITPGLLLVFLSLMMMVAAVLVSYLCCHFVRTSSLSLSVCGSEKIRA